MASELWMTDGVGRVTTGTTLQALSQSIEVSAYDQLDLMLWINGSEGIPTAAAIGESPTITRQPINRTTASPTGGGPGVVAPRSIRPSAGRMVRPGSNLRTAASKIGVITPGRTALGLNCSTFRNLRIPAGYVPTIDKWDAIDYLWAPFLAHPWNAAVEDGMDLDRILSDHTTTDVNGLFFTRLFSGTLGQAQDETQQFGRHMWSLRTMDANNVDSSLSGRSFNYQSPCRGKATFDGGCRMSMPGIPNRPEAWRKTDGICTTTSCPTVADWTNPSQCPTCP